MGGIIERHKGYRLNETKEECDKKTKPEKNCGEKGSMHYFGLAIDINYTGNPFVRGEFILDVIKDASLLLSGTPDSAFRYP